MLEKKLNELNIFALRDLARRTGVNSPTSKKKEELIKGILEIMSGEKKPDQTKTKQGRPPKVFAYDFLGMINPQNQTDLSKITLNQPKVKYEDKDIATVAGWIELVGNNSAILWVEKNLKNEIFFVSKDAMKDYNIKMGDRVVAEVCLDENTRVVKQIFSINDNPILKFSNSRTEYDEICHVLPKLALQFQNQAYNQFKFLKGENVFIYGSNNNQNTTVAVDMLMSAKIENKIYINISLSERNKLYLSNLKNTENFVSLITDDVDVAKRIVMLAIERAKRILELGEDVVVVVDDLQSIVGIDSNLNLIKSFVTLAKSTDNNGSITLLAIMPNDSQKQIEKLADKKIKITEKTIELL